MSKATMQSYYGRDRDEAHRIVRRFSQRVGDTYPQNTVAQGLQFAEECEQSHEQESERKAITIAENSKSSKTAIALLDAEMDQLNKAWADLLIKMPKDDRAGMSKQTSNFDAVRSAIDVWVHRFEKEQEIEYSTAKGHFHRFCDTVDSYSSLLAFIPADDKYLKPFCGALTTIVQASVSHGKVANGFASALADIGVEMTYSKDLLSTSRSRTLTASVDRLVPLVAQLCTKIFRFLLPYLQWGQSRWERVKGSLDKTYLEKNIQVPLDDILKTSRNLSREAEIQRSKVLIRTEALVEDDLSLGKENRAFLENIDRNMERMMQERQETTSVGKLSQPDLESIARQCAAMLAVGLSEKSLLQSTTANTMFSQDLRYSSSIEAESKPQLLSNVAQTDPVQQVMHEYSFANLEYHTRPLMAFSNSFLVEDVQVAPMTTSTILEPLQEWLAAPHSRTLWIYGPSNVLAPSHLSSTSTYVASVVKSMKLPLLAHRCRSEDRGPDSMMIMVYSFILQLVWLLPDQFSTTSTFDSSRFAILDGTSETLEEALILMEDLLRETPHMLVCVLDGIQMIEHEPEGVDEIGLLLDMFFEILKESKEGKVLKVLLTTDGFSHRLSKRLDPGEQVNAMREVGTSRGHGRRSEVALSNMIDEDDKNQAI